MQQGDIELQAFGRDHIEGAVALSRQENWPHRPQDWQMALLLSRGVVALDDQGRVTGTILVTPYGVDCAMINMVIGPGTQPGVAIGPMINMAAVEKINRHVEDALAKGAVIVTEKPSLPEGPQYVAPLVLTGATHEMQLAGEETFGPVAPLFRFETEEEAIAIANGTPYGLASYFYTENLKRAWRVGEALEFGMVGLNTGSVSIEVAPFGGVKLSGLGREGAQAGIEEYLEMKSFHIGGLG